MSKLQAVLVSFCVFAVVLFPLPAANAATTLWSDGYPSTGLVTIPAGETVVIDQDVDLDGLTIEGTLRCAANRDVELQTRFIDVIGTLKCGSFRNRHQANFTITLTGPGNPGFSAHGDKYLVSQPGSSVRLYGQQRTAWVRLTQTAPAGATTLELENNDWQVGDRIAIAPTDFDQYQAEQVTIVGVSGNTVTIDRPLDYMHYCGTETYGSKWITECAEVGLLSRNITIRGDAESATTQVGGHAMFMQGSRILIDGVEFWRMGQVGRAGRYPAHFHLFGDASTSKFQNNSIWESYNRWVTLHGTQNLRLRNNVAYDGIGHGYYLEDGDEIGNKIVGNLGILTREGEPGRLVTPSDNEPAAFWIANPDNDVINNVAAGADHSGFWYSLPERPLGTSTADLWPRQTPLGAFYGNVAHSVGFAGLMFDLGERPDRTLETVWYNPVQVPGDPNSGLVEPRFTNFTTYKSRHYGLWLRTFSGVTFRNFAIADTWRSVYVANIQAGGGRENTGTIVNSLLVGETSNVGQPESWETTGVDGRSLPKFWDPDAELGGVPFYDGPLQVNSTVFANFEGNSQRDAGALTNLFPNQFWVHPNNGVTNATFINAQRVLLPDVVEYVDGDATAVFVDWNGSVTGTVGASIAVQNALVDNDTCTPRPEWNAVECGRDVGYTSVVVNRTDGGSPQIQLLRDDGRQLGFDGAPNNGSAVYFTMVSEMRHQVVWDGAVASGFDLYVAGVSKMGSRGARLTFPAPSGTWEFQVNGQYSSAASINALDSGPSNWFYDAATNQIHLRLVGDNNWVTMR